MEKQLELREAILETELAMTLCGWPRTASRRAIRSNYYADGYPKLPDCLRRMAKP